MRFLTIRAKVTLWYTCFMIVFAAVILGLLLTFSDTALLNRQKKQLTEAVEDAAEDIREGEDIDFFDDGIYLLRYSEQKEYTEGSPPDAFPLSTPLVAGQIQTIKTVDSSFYVYDQKLNGQANQVLWLRGVTPTTKAGLMNRVILGSAFLLLPIMVFLSSIAGYFITKRAFLPVKNIQETAQKITESGDLSMRIGLPPGKDEIARLGQTMDHMLSKLENSFLKEKQFTSDASHELRTPVSVILTESEYILQHGSSFEEARESMEVVNRQANKLSALINQLLFFTRADRDAMELQYETVDIPALIEDLVHDSRTLAENRSITLSTTSKLSSTTEYRVDKVLFTRALQNIIQNAIFYGLPNGHVDITVYQSDGYLSVKVEDDGIGISNEHLPKIWDRFYQADPSRNEYRPDNMGLGLSMVKWIVEKHGGYATVESTLGKGSTFILYFPEK